MIFIEIIFMLLILASPILALVALIRFVVRKIKKMQPSTSVWRSRNLAITSFVALVIGVVGIGLTTDTEDIANSFEEGLEAGKEAAASETQSDDDPEVEEQSGESIVVEKASSERLEDYITAFDTYVTEYDDQDLYFVGVDFGQEEIPTILGIKNVEGEYIGEFTMQQGMNRDSKKNAELILYFELESTIEVDPRSEKQVTLPEITVVDDQGVDGKKIASTPLDKYYKTNDERVIGAIGFSVFSDSNHFEVKINDKVQFMLEDLPYRTE